MAYNIPDTTHGTAIYAYIVPISWGGFGGVNVYRRIWQSHGVFGYGCGSWHQDTKYVGPTDETDAHMSECFRPRPLQLWVPGPLVSTNDQVK